MYIWVFKKLYNIYITMAIIQYKTSYYKTVQKNIAFLYLNVVSKHLLLMQEICYCWAVLVKVLLILLFLGIFTQSIICNICTKNLKGVIHCQVKM